MRRDHTIGMPTTKILERDLPARFVPYVPRASLGFPVDSSYP